MQPKRRYFKLPVGANSNDYHRNIINVKVKPEFLNLLRNLESASDEVSEILNYLEIGKIRPVSSGKGNRNRNARIGNPSKIEISLYQTFEYNGPINIEKAINLLYSTGMVEYAEPAYVEKIDFVPNDSLIAQQYYLDLVKAIDAWDITMGDTSVVIAIVDSGVDLNHPDISDNIWKNPNDPIDGVDNDGNGFIDDYHGWDFAGALANNQQDGDNNPDIKKGGGHEHGLSVAGVASGVTNNVTGLAGIGYNTRIMVTKHFADDQPEDAISYASNPYQGVIYAAEAGADIINCSWGSTFRSQFNQDIMNYVALDLGVLVVSSSGNSGKEESHYPSDYENVLSVSGIDRSLKKSNFTTYGKGVDIAAPGSSIAVLQYDGTYGFTQGTSFSSPMVAGAAGLVKAKYPELTGLQVGELLRVSANDTIYEINSSSTFKNKLGKGVLDVYKALTTQPSAIRMLSFRLLNDEGKTPKLGEEANFIADFKNFLWPSSSGLKIRLTSKSVLLEVLQENSDLGKIEMNQVVTNAGSPFRVKIREDIPTNLKVDLLLEFEDGEYTDHQFLSILLNPTFLNIEENLVSTSLAENGRIGFQDTEQNEGLGFSFDGSSSLYEMGLMLGNSEAQVSSSVRSTAGVYDDDFLSTTRISDLTPGDFSAAEISGSFNDSQANDSSSNVHVNYRSMVWKEAPNDQFFIIEYTIKNEGDSTLNSFYSGLYADWDISEDGGKDRADWYNELNLGYVYGTDPLNQNYTGIQVLSDSSNYWAIDNNASTQDNPWGVYDGFSDEEKYSSMSSKIGRQQAGFADSTGADVSHAVSAGPFTIDAGDSITIAFAIHGANSLDDLINSAKAADTMYNYTLQEAVPVIEDIEICHEDSATLKATGAAAYKWYRTKTGGTPFLEDSVFTTGILRNDTTFYVSNAENNWESVRTPVNITIKANPTIQLGGSQFLCDGDTTTLMVAEADSYLWSPGNENTKFIEVAQEGAFSVTVTYDSLGCISTSKELNIVQNSSPSASFDISDEAIEKNIDVNIEMTDQSSNASNWFWKLSDGQTSIEQNPTFTVNTSRELEIQLVATSLDGCQDDEILIIDVITGLDDEPTKLSQSINLYPNPSSGELNLEVTNEYMGKLEITLVNTMGKIIKHLIFNKNSEFTSQIIDLYGLPQGMYILKINQEPLGQSASRIVIQ